MEKRNRQLEEGLLVSKMLHQAVVGLEKNDQEDSREKHPMNLIDDGKM